MGDATSIFFLIHLWNNNCEQIIMIIIIKLFNLYIISTFIFFPKILFYYQIILYLYTIPKCELLHSIYIYVYI